MTQTAHERALEAVAKARWETVYRYSQGYDNGTWDETRADNRAFLIRQAGESIRSSFIDVYLRALLDDPETVEDMARAIRRRQIVTGITIEPELVDVVLEREWETRAPDAQAALSAIRKQAGIV
ncbi:hypothetical protein [Tautonia plasticadhaerens]|uniref:Uncharacterized protein n=1 Tax=Tautonia plasticadhaerens TaxID=2527974 RepID=A0A518H287_9BACT|nr:hypothetical protein [Tautonia plasticadhaerens]QDV34958.1 hypothetical protein ElP_28550 [Tautonia plasticadhaerens]